MRIVDEAAVAAALAQVPAPPAGPRVVCSGNHATPWPLLGMVDRALETYRLFMLNAQPGVPDRPGVRLESPFVGPGMRDAERLDYLPARLSMVPLLFRSTLPPDVVVLHVSAPYDGTVSLGTEVNVLPAALEAVRERGGLVVAQINSAMPFTHGDGVLGLEEIDLAIEHDSELEAPPERSNDLVAAQVGERVAALVPQDATLQLGIGAIPDAVLGALSGRSGLRVWSEMFSDGVLELHESGQLDPDVHIVCTFLFGRRPLYDFVDRNPRVRVLRTETVNAPSAISRQPRMTSINTALQVDLFAQANASRRPGQPGRVYSGTGGQTDFVVGALHAPGGQAIIALPSWARRADASTVVPLLDCPATSSQHSRIVTEQGVASILGASQGAQAAALIERCAHPDARDGLRDAAARHATSNA